MKEMFINNGPVTVEDMNDALNKLRRTPSLLNIMIESYGFDMVELSESNKYDIISQHDIISDILYTVRDTIIETLEEVDRLTRQSSKAANDPTKTE